MVNVSKRKLDDYFFNRFFDLLFEIFVVKRNKDEFKKFFVSLFSKKERIALIKRVGIIYLTIKKIHNFDICSVLKISTATLNKYQTIIDKNEVNYSYFKSIIKKERIKSTLEEVLSKLYGYGTPGVDWSEAWKRRKQIQRRKRYGV